MSSSILPFSSSSSSSAKASSPPERSVGQTGRATVCCATLSRSPGRKRRRRLALVHPASSLPNDKINKTLEPPPPRHTCCFSQTSTWSREPRGIRRCRDEEEAEEEGRRRRGRPEIEEEVDCDGVHYYTTSLLSSTQFHPTHPDRTVHPGSPLLPGGRSPEPRRPQAERPGGVERVGPVAVSFRTTSNRRVVLANVSRKRAKECHGERGSRKNKV